jgi:hypothetical protein
MKVTITNVTGSQKEEALLDKDSGVIEFKSGEISHVFYEKQLNKSIFVVKEAKKEEPKPLEVKQEVEEVKVSSANQSEPRQEKKTSKKSK